MEDLPDPGGAAPEVPGYDVGRLLGRGGTAVVWLVTERRTGRDFALKCFDAGADTAGESAGEAGGEVSGTAYRETEDAMRREVRILSVLDHDHLLRAHTVLRVGDRQSGLDGTKALGLVLDYAPGGSVADVVAGRGRLGAGETVTVLTPIAQALQYLHSHGFTHGDVSPGNVLFTAHGKPLLADLGVARMVADNGSDRIAGTEGFSDPAPVDAVRAGLQPERDIYSLAALGWYCLTGRTPAAGAGRPPLPLLVPDVPPALAAALEAGLDEDRRKRPSAAEFAAAVYRSTVAEPVDLSVTADASVAPQLLTRRALPRSARERRAHWFRRWLRRPLVSQAPLQERAAGPAPVAAPPGAHTRTPAATARHAAAGGTARHAAAGSGPGSHRDPGADSGRVRGPDAEPIAGSGAGPNYWPSLGDSTVQPAGEDIRQRSRTETRPPTDHVSRPGANRKARHDSAPGMRPGTFEAGRRRRRRKRWVGAAIAVTLLAGLGAARLHPGNGIPELFAAPPPAAAAGAPPASAPGVAGIPRELRDSLESADPGEAVRGLASLRSLAFSTGDVRLLEQVNVPASAAADADARIGARLAAAGHVLAGFETTLARVQTIADGGPDRTVVDVSAVASPYQERDAAGHVVAEVPAGEETRLRLVLASIDGRWRIAQILAGDPASG
ncbi:serine/threonine-protein kinase [Arthrobacter sp. NPDC058130]|uniref:serine/threonine-protein kinase n=1 Tax=Arthrobacter sp. NPDC058130 TaxID=3346353 RepID=UPI0036E0748F